MTRFVFGGGPEDVYLIQDVTTGFLKPGAGAQALFYDSSGMTNRLTDLQTLTGQPISSVTTENAGGVWAPGQIAPLFGPNDVTQMYVSVAGSPPYLITAHTFDDYALPLLQQLTQLLTQPAERLVTLDDVDSTSVQAGTTGQALVKLASGLWGAGTVASGGGGGSAPANMATTDTVQTITAAKTLSALLTANAGVLAKPSAVGAVAAIMQALAGQTANLAEWRNSAGTAISWVGPDGNIYAPNMGVTIPLSATALSNGTGALFWTNDRGTALKIRSVRATLGAALTTGTVTFDPKVNSTSIYSVAGNRPSITGTSKTSGKNTGFTSGSTIPDGATVSVDVSGTYTGSPACLFQIDAW